MSGEMSSVRDAVVEAMRAAADHAGAANFRVYAAAKTGDAVHYIIEWTGDRRRELTFSGAEGPSEWQSQPERAAKWVVEALADMDRELFKRATSKTPIHDSVFGVQHG